MAGNMILFSTLSDQNDNIENVDGDTVLRDGPLGDSEAENFDESAAEHHDEGGVGGVERDAEAVAAAEPQDEGGLEGVDTEADAGKEHPRDMIYNTLRWRALIMLLRRQVKLLLKQTRT